MKHYLKIIIKCIFFIILLPSLIMFINNTFIKSSTIDLIIVLYWIQLYLMAGVYLLFRIIYTFNDDN